MASPIWKDYYVSLGTGTRTRFRILDSSDTVIYEGMAVMRPGASTNSVRINDVCADYMRVQPLPFTGGLVPSTAFTFTVQSSADGSVWTTRDTVTFVPDWSYDYSTTQRTVLSDPVNGIVDPRQMLLWSTAQTGMITVIIRYANGGTSQIYVPVNITADFNDDFNSDYATETVTRNGGTLGIDLSDYDNIAGVQIGSTVYTVAQPCHRYVLYYRNIYGGWDSLTGEGTPKRTDSLTRHQARQEYDNRESTARGLRDYAVEVVRGYTLRTGWLTDSQSARMVSLLGTVDAYLHDLESGLVWPAVLTGSSIEHKTYYNNGRRLVSYDITLQIAQEMVRR